MANSVKPRNIIVQATNIHLLFDLLVIIVEKNNHGEIDSTGLQNQLKFSFWASDGEYSEIVNTFKNSTFDIKIVDSEEQENGGF